VLLGYRPMPLAATLGVDGLNGSSKACLSGFPGHVPPRSPDVPTPIHREPQEVEATRSFPSSLARRRPPEVYEAGLVRVKAQAVSLQPCAENTHYPLCILHVLEADDEIIRVSDEDRFPVQTRRVSYSQLKRVAVTSPNNASWD
jgi:hypothetical protein